MKTEGEYIPFGEEWKNELMKLPKIQIIAFLRAARLELDERASQSKQITEDDIQNIIFQTEEDMVAEDEDVTIMEVIRAQSKAVFGLLKEQP